MADVKAWSWSVSLRCSVADTFLDWRVAGVRAAVSVESKGQ